MSIKNYYRKIITNLVLLLSLFCLLILSKSEIVFAAYQIENSDLPLVWIKPPVQIANAGDYVDVEIRLDNNNLPNVLGVGIIAKFDPSLLEVVDVTGSPVDQIIHGSCPAADFIVTNSVNEGNINYGVVQGIPSTPCMNGDIARVFFRCTPSIKTEKKSLIIIETSVLSDPDASLIPHKKQNGEFICKPNVSFYLPLIQR